MVRRVARGRADVSENLSASIKRGTRIVELETREPLIFLRSGSRLLVMANVVASSPILVTLMKEAISSSETRLLQEPHGVTSQKTPFFIVTAVKTSNLTNGRQHILQ
jgi:hypothetical protein